MAGVKKWYFWLCFFALVEFLLMGRYKTYFGIYFTPIVFALSSFAVGWLGLYASVHLGEQTYTDRKQVDWPVLVMALMPLAILSYHGYSIFRAHPIDYRESDVFAQVITPSQLLLQGKYPYADVALPGYTMHNTYLPMQWIPFIIPVAFGFDPRWVPIIVWCLALLTAVFLFGTKSIKGSSLLFLALVMAFCIFGISGFMDAFTDEYCRTLELLPAAYYIFLILFLLKGRWLGIGLSLGACLLSRFSVVFFLPFLAWYVWKRWGTNILYKAAVTVIVMVMGLFVLPFLTRDPIIVSNIINNYKTGAENEWHTHSWQNPGDEPYQLAKGFGAAIFVKKMYEYDKKDGIHHLRQATLVFSILTAVFLIYLYHRNRKFQNRDWVLLGGFKLYFTVFYTLSLIPYSYLFLVPVSVTVMILIKGIMDLLNQRSVQYSLPAAES